MVNVGISSTHNKAKLTFLLPDTFTDQVHKKLQVLVYVVRLYSLTQKPKRRVIIPTHTAPTIHVHIPLRPPHTIPHPPLLLP